MIVIVDYGIGNIFNILKCLKSLNKKIIVSNNEKEILNSNFLILPGVGSFGYAAAKLKKSNLDKTIIEYVNKGKFLLGTCVGMQLLMTKSYEDGVHDGLNLIPGNVNHLKILNKKNLKIKYPHIGWSKINILNKKISSKLKIQDKDFYFVHSYYSQPTDKKDIVGFTDYSNMQFPSIIKKENVIGFQFHFEISGKNGLTLIDNLFKNFDI